MAAKWAKWTMVSSTERMTMMVGPRQETTMRVVVVWKGGGMAATLLWRRCGCGEEDGAWLCRKGCGGLQHFKCGSLGNEWLLIKWVRAYIHLKCFYIYEVFLIFLILKR